MNNSIFKICKIKIAKINPEFLNLLYDFNILN